MNQDQSALSTPNHLGFILDGNRRWAKKHGLPTYEGHLAGYHALKDVILKAADCGVRFVSIYAFSTENWKRPSEEVDGLMSLALRIFKTDIAELIKNEINVRILGAREGIPPKLLKAMEDVEEKSKHFTRTTVAVCFNYGGQREIIDAANACIADGLTEITEDSLRERLYEPQIPDIDLVVRTSGEERISNFMLWRVAYSEFYFIDKLWPDMRPSDVDDIIKEYSHRNRRFGGS
ncbi:MAG TPA: polyprenyl diphosphate synthase [Magnetospirillaceae bacterium]|nr:polyprenyl diphosphate synthase [Magnetospirillaceae bacterium]